MEKKIGTLAGDLHAGSSGMADVCTLDGTPTGERLEVHDVMTPDGQYLPAGAKSIIATTDNGQWFVVACEYCPCKE